MIQGQKFNIETCDVLKVKEFTCVNDGISNKHKAEIGLLGLTTLKNCIFVPRFKRVKPIENEE